MNVVIAVLKTTMLGVNAIFVFVASGWVGVLLNKIQVEGHSLHHWILYPYSHVFTDSRLSSLAFALTYVAFWWLVLWLMSLKNWSIRV
jgi:predicted acyltransferase